MVELMKPGSGLPLHDAVMDGALARLDDLLIGGSAPDAQDAQGFTALHLAAQEHSVAAASALLSWGAAVDAENGFGNTPLFVAVFNSRGRGELIELLQAAGADPHHANASGQTPLGLARLIGNYDVARFFDD